MNSLDDDKGVFQMTPFERGERCRVDAIIDGVVILTFSELGAQPQAKKKRKNFAK